MRKSILQLGTQLTRSEQSKVRGGVTCHHVTADFEIQVTQDAIGHRLYVDGVFTGYLSGNIEAHNTCSRAAELERAEFN